MLFLVSGAMIYFFTLYQTDRDNNDFLPPEQQSKRGDILSADGYHLAKTQKLYEVVLDRNYIDPKKEEEFIELLSIYGKINMEEIKEHLRANGRFITISKKIHYREARQLVKLNTILWKNGVFISYETSKGEHIEHGIKINESGEIREYPYGKLLTPVLGYTRTMEDKGIRQICGIKGLEKFFDQELTSNTSNDLNNQYKSFSIKLNIPMKLQMDVEKIADNYKRQFQADEIIATVMESKTGKILSQASSNRYNPSDISPEHYTSLNTNAIELSYEPGAMISPILSALLLDKHLTRQSEIINGLKQFGFTNFSGIDLPYEKRGSIPSYPQLVNDRNKLITTYDYGMRANSIQLLKAFNVFNNNGYLVNPMIVNALIDTNGKTIPVHTQNPVQIISPATAQQMKQNLIKAVNAETGTLAKMSGLEIGGTTGTTCFNKEDQYSKNGITSYIGFANDHQHTYTIGITVIKPRITYFSTHSAVPIFKAIVDLMVKQKYLTVKNDA
ncbi:MAG: penicillin-binding transpeptidase domain-containing protein [Sulfuricurvum sp.]|nr:penicillin-binding transpeptidase domain-containing protein [Sulfuricurvum sp.]